MTLRDRQLRAATILVIEDDGAIREGLVDALGFANFEPSRRSRRWRQ